MVSPERMYGAGDTLALSKEELIFTEQYSFLGVGKSGRFGGILVCA